MAADVVVCLRKLSVALEDGDVDAARSLVDRLLCPSKPERPVVDRVGHRAGGVRLTGREAATLHHLPDGSMSRKDIASELDVSPNTVKTHLKSIYQKLGVHCRGEAIHRARELGLLPPS